ncbi:hypothetical protein KP509_28G060500 [Ceratopteris richardii]|uniref:Uncharacterized protein n=1 Tax=Ceratopteris richardii TaxID=49495 RepID=A0A8T2RCT1_CERRI|nr:hypothetical protein KP509_28G060500 [Ceratopteris richardii]
MESRICVFKVSVISADKVWTANAGKDSGKAAVSVRFPGQDAADIYQSDAVMPSPPEQCTADEASTDEPQQATQNNPDSKKNKDKSERIPQSSSNCGGDSSTPLSFCFQAFSDYVRASDWLLCHQIVTEPLAISLLWISPSSQTSTIVGTVSIDLSELLFSNELFFEKVCVIEADETKKALPTKKDGQKATSKGKKGNALDEVPPHLSPGATMKINVTLDTPILSENDRDESVLLDFRDFCVLKVPPQNSALNASAATYSLAFEIPGFVGPWWSELTFSGKEMKESIGVARFDNGLVSNISSPQQSSMTSSLTANHNMEEETANSDDSGTCGRLTSLDSISWNASFRRFLPSVAVRQLKEDIMRKKTWHGEIANYSTTDQSVSSFDRDHLCFDLDLAALLNEGICETRICSALKLYIADQPLLRDKNTVNKILKNDSGHESTDQNSPWETYSSELAFCIKLNRSLQPAWVSPPKPQLTLEDVLPMRPKPPSNIDKLKIAVKEFQDLVQEGAQSIFLLQEKIASESMSKLENPVSEWRYRVEHKDELRQSISSELLRSGTWHHLKEEMKQRIVKIACEMLRFRKESQENNFEFYNSLYVQLLEVIHKSLKDLDSMRMEGFLSYSGGLESGASGRVYTRDQLRQLADNYEAVRLMRTIYLQTNAMKRSFLKKGQILISGFSMDSF